MRAAKTGTMFVVYTNPSTESANSASTVPKQYKDFLDVFEKKMPSLCLSIGPMIVPLIFKMELNLFWAQFTIYCRMNFPH